METRGEAEIRRRFHAADNDWAEEAAKKLPMGQLVQPDQLAGLIAYVLSLEADVLTGSLIFANSSSGGSIPCNTHGTQSPHSALRWSDSLHPTHAQLTGSTVY